MKDVLINIKGSQSAEGGNETLEMITVGKLSKKNGNYYLSYPECDENGMEGVTTMLKIDQNQSVVLQRSGDIHSRMLIEKNRRHISHYDTGFGGMMVGVFGESVRSTIKDDGGELFMRYTVDINSSYTSTNEISISVKEAAPGGCQN